MTFPRIIVFAAALCSPGRSQLRYRANGRARAVDEPSGTVPLYTNLGSHHKGISTRVPATQQYFDQGLRLVYGFNHAEAIRSFTRAAELDPTCAMCYWGIALAYGPHVNAPMDSASGVAAYAAAQRALSLSPTPRRLSAHISGPSRSATGRTRRPIAPRLDSAYARAMGRSPAPIRTISTPRHCTPSH